ncbi:post-transcriptional regulator [Heyndrickxia sporothermodurans]
MTSSFLKGRKGMQEAGHSYDQYFKMVEPALKSKAEELELIGYGQVSTKDIWNYFIKKKWKKVKIEVHIHELVSDILALKSGEFMNFTTVEAFRSPNWFAELNEEELQELLKPKVK